MRDWNLRAGDPLSLTLAADARLSRPNYVDDQIWELVLGGGEPPSLALQTTYGLRARNMRLLPRFVEGFNALTDPEQFATPPVVRRFYPNFLQLTFSPLPEIEVVAEYWAPLSSAVAGRLQVINQGQSERLVRLELIAALTPIEGGVGMAPQNIEHADVLVGSSGGLAPVMFITGGASAVSSPYPALVMGLELQPGKARQFIWCQAALHSPEASFELARGIAGRNWEAERARIELLNAGQVEILTGDADWDAAFALAQKTALGLFVGPTENLPHASPVESRLPDDGYSLRGDGLDYNHLWSGQNPFEAYYLSDLILPGSPELARGLALNFIATQGEDGEIDGKPGLGGQRNRRQAAPLLASLAWRIYESDPRDDFLAQVFEPLLAFLRAWFTTRHDRDGDGVPEWDHPLQAGLDDHPQFSRWHAWAQGTDIATAESPALATFLFQECQSLIRMAGILGKGEPIPELEARSEQLRAAVEASWVETLASYLYRDRDGHTSPPALNLGERQGPGHVRVERAFTGTARLVLRVESSQESTRRSQVFIHGTAPSGHHRVERLGADRFLWFPGLGTVTSERIYSAVDYVDVQGIQPDDRVSVLTAGFDFQDLTTLVPLWGGIPSPELAQELVQCNLHDPKRYWIPYGLPECPAPPAPPTLLASTASPQEKEAFDPPEAAVCHKVNLIWNMLIGHGMNRYGFRAEAAELLQHIMAAIVKSLKNESAFRRSYHPTSGQGMGERNALSGLVPLGFFLDTLGVRVIAPDQVALEGTNPFPWPVTVKYRGLTVMRGQEKTQVIFPDGQTVSVDDPAPRLVMLE
jgi:hypothetical protein